MTSSDEAQRRELALQRAEPRPTPSSTQSVMSPPIRQGCVGYQVGLKLVRTARARMLKRELEQDRGLETIAEAAGVTDSRPGDPYCSFCGPRWKLRFIDGVRSRTPCPCLHAKRRRLRYKQSAFHCLLDPLPKPVYCADTVDQRDADVHLLFVADELTFCWRFGSYSIERVHRLNVNCRGAPGDGQGYRLGRMTRG